MDAKAHWTQVYQTKAVNDVSWYQEHPEQSLAFIRSTGIAPDAAIIDVGAGASTLVDDLIANGYRDITLLDISEPALDVVRSRLGETPAHISYLAGDITTIDLPHHHYDLWHDRAVFHFLTDPDQQRRYIEQVTHAVKPGGHVIVATFGPNGPEKCSGLTTARYDAESLHRVFGSHFTLTDSLMETHKTPWGSEQQFVYCYCRKDADG